MQPGLTVVLCSYNGSARLPATLAALMEQTLPSAEWNVLVVDNASTDGSADAARAAWTRTDVRLDIVTETEPGQMRAREKGLAEAGREFVCFCDDDNWLAPDYLQIALTILRQQPRAGVVGGRGLAVCEVPLPPWFDLAAHGYAVGPQAATEEDVSRSRSFVYGAGMVLRLAAWRQLAATNFTSRLFGREPGKVNSGDDNEMCLGLALLGWRIHYSPQLVFRHCMAPHRLEAVYCRKLFRSFGEAMIVLNAYRDFLIGRATPSAWRGCALRRLAQSWLVRLAHRVRPADAGPLTELALRREIRRGFAEASRGYFYGGRIPALYAEIAAWLATAKKGSV